MDMWRARSLKGENKYGRNKLQRGQTHSYSIIYIFNLNKSTVKQNHEEKQQRKCQEGLSKNIPLKSFGRI